MSPTIYREGAYRFYFHSNEESRMHVHVACPDGKAKFWLEPFIAPAFFRGIKRHQLKKVEKIIEEQEEEFKNAWNRHFTQNG